jgi:hypothetical protein
MPKMKCKACGHNCCDECPDFGLFCMQEGDKLCVVCEVNEIDGACIDALAESIEYTYSMQCETEPSEEKTLLYH